MKNGVLLEDGADHPLVVTLAVRLDEEACAGYGLCNRHLPRVFELDDWGYAHVAGDGTIVVGEEVGARRAVETCPMAAIELVETSPPIG